MEMISLDLDPDAPSLPVWIPAGHRVQGILLDMRWSKFNGVEVVLDVMDDQIVADTGGDR